MAVQRAVLNLKIKSCCLQRATNMISPKKFLVSPNVRQISAQYPKSSEIGFLTRFFPRYSQVARYYVKAKEKKGPSIKTWLSVGSFLLIGGTGFIVYLGEYS